MVLLPALFWGFGINARQELIQPRCASRPALCSPETVNPLDRLSLGIQNDRADDLSFFTQNMSGYLAWGGNAAWASFLLISGQVTPVGAVLNFGVSLVLLTEGVVINGFLDEIARALVQRPRPFVYSDPINLGKDPSHYTSFYSGHTSFAAVTGVSFFANLIGNGAPIWLVALSGTAIGTLIILTGVFRVLAGRHFITDVGAGAIAGIGIALFVALYHRRRNPS